MQRASFSLAARTAFATGLVAAGIALAAGPVLASGLNSRLVPGFQTGVSCLTPRLCVVTGYNNHGVGDVVPIRDGVPGPASARAGSKALYSVSCPGPSGCVAVGQMSVATGALLVRLSSSGGIASSTVVSVPAGVTLSRIACITLSSCVLTGTNIFASPEVFEVGHWDGSSLSLYQASIPHGVTAPVLEAVSCSGSACVAVGGALQGTRAEGFVLDIAGGRPAHLHVVAGASLYGVSCTSPTLCYADGFNQSGGLAVAVRAGVAGAPVDVAFGDLFGIACRSTSCTAVGEKLAPPGAPAKDAYYGTLVGLSAGKVTSTQEVALSDGFTNVAQIQGTYTALGAGHGSGSEVTTGS